MPYEPRAVKQLTGSRCAPKNCQSAVMAMVIDRMTLGLVQKTADEIRYLTGTADRCLDADRSNDAITQGEALIAATKLGVYPTAYDSGDKITNERMKAIVQGGTGVSLAGSYAVVPIGLRGDRESGSIAHRIYVNEWQASVAIPARYEFPGFTGPAYRVFDPLADGRIDQPSGKRAPLAPVWWPEPIVHAFAEARFSGAANVNLVAADRSFATVKVTLANVRSGPTTAAAKLGTLPRGAQLEAAAKPDIGLAVSGDPRWWRVWYGSRVAWMHSSVITISGG